jgi:hypothetical protein
VAGLGALVFAADVARDAAACSVPAPGWTTSLYTTAVPTDGVVVVKQHCFHACEAPPQLEIVVRDLATGDIVAGEATLIGDAGERAFGWRATNELTEGSYEVLLMGNSRGLTVVAPAELGLDAVAIIQTIDTAETYEGDSICCPTGPINSCGGEYCYNTQYRRYALPWVMWSGAAAPAHFSQYLYRATFDGLEPEPWKLEYTGASSGSVDEPRSEYCYTFEAKSLIDESVTTIERGCLEHPPGATLGVFDRDPVDIANDLRRCEAPPAGQEGDWCEARAAYCEEFEQVSCAELEKHCSDRGADGESGGCSLARRSDAPRSSAWTAALVLALAAALRRVRRASSRARSKSAVRASS